MPKTMGRHNLPYSIPRRTKCGQFSRAAGGQWITGLGLPVFQTADFSPDFQQGFQGHVGAWIPGPASHRLYQVRRIPGGEVPPHRLLPGDSNAGCGTNAGPAITAARRPERPNNPVPVQFPAPVRCAPLYPANSQPPRHGPAVP